MTDTALPAACGILVAPTGESLPLTGVRIDAEVHPGAIAVDVTATFVNDLDRPLEVTYLTPLPAGFSPVGAECRLAGGTVRAELVSRADARRAYDDAVADGRTAAIAEQVGEDLFSLTIGNVAPDEAATIRISLVGTVEVDDGQATLRLPLSAGERYQPLGTAGRQPPRRGAAGRREPTATVTVRTTGVVPTVTSHDATYEPDDASAGHGDAGDHPTTPDSAADSAAAGDARARGVGGMTVVRVEGVPLVDDVVVRWPATAGWTAALTLDDGEHRAAGPATPGAEPREGGRASSAVGPAAGRERGGRGWLTVTGTTAPAAERAGRDVVVLLDRSGSMGGWQMGAARDVARAIVERLGSSDRLCVLAFDTELATVPGAVGFAAAAPAHRRKVQEWLTTVEARGGTELTRAFVTAAGLVAGSDRATIVIVTDAEIGDEDRCLAAIRMADADVLTVGVGGRVNRGLITAIADTSGGWSTIVESPERLEDAVGDIARRCAGEALRIEQVTVGGADRVEWSGPHPRLVAGHQTVLRAEVEGMPTTVTVSGPGYRTIVPVSTGGPAAAHPLWARARVAELLRAEGREADALRIALDGSVLCRLTAFVAVDPSGRQLDAVPTRVEVGHLGGAGRGGAPMVKLAMPAAAPMAARARTFVPPPPMAVSPAGAPPTPDRQPAPSPGSAASTAPARFEALVAEIAARDGLTVDAAERSRLLGDWAERVAEFLTGDDAPTAKSLAAALAAAIVGSDDAWTRLIAWCVRAGRS